jgi:hypothetical protein
MHSTDPDPGTVYLIHLDIRDCNLNGVTPETEETPDD